MANNLTMSSPVYGTGKFSQGLTGGVGESPVGLLPTNGPFTIECWFSVTSTQLNGTLQAICGEGAAAWIGVNGGGQLMAIYGTTDAQVGPGSASINDGTLHHAALVVDAANGQPSTLYLDGVLIGSNSAVRAIGNSNVFAVRGLGGVGFLFGGMVDEVAIWNFAKYTANFTPSTTAIANNAQGLVALYHLDGNGTDSFTPAADTTPPTLSSAVSSDGTSISLSFSETLAAQRPAASAFTLNGSTFTTVGGTGSTVLLSGITPAYAPGNPISVSYSRPAANPLQDPSGNQVASFTNFNVTNSVVVRPTLPGYILKVFGDQAADDFHTEADVRNYLNGLDCTTQPNPVMIWLRKTMDLSGNQYGPTNSNGSLYVTVRPAPGLSFDELEADNAPGAYGTVGIECVVNSDCQIRQGLIFDQVKIRLNSGRIAFRRDGWGQGGSVSGLLRGRLFSTMTGTYPIVTGEYGGGAVFTDSLLIMDGANTNPFIHASADTPIQRCTVVRRNGAVGGAAVLNDYNNTIISNSLFAGCGGAPTGPNTGAGNFTDTALTVPISGFTAYTGQFFESSSDYRPAAGSPMLGAADQFAISTNDNNGNNRGTAPDSGAFQRTPATPLVISACTSQVVDGTSLVMAFTTTNTPTSGTVTLVPDPTNPMGASSVGPIPVVLGTNTGSLTIDDIPPGLYTLPVGQFTNAGGSHGTTGFAPFEIAGVGNLVYDTGASGVDGTPTPPESLAPTVSISTADVNIMSGTKATITGVFNLQGDPTGAINVFMYPQPSGTPVAMPAPSKVGSIWTCVGDVPPGSFKFGITATANSKTASAQTGAIEVLLLANTVNLPV